MCFVVTCWEMADLLALVCGVYCEFVTFPLVSWVRCGTWLHRFLISAPLLTLNARENKQDKYLNPFMLFGPRREKTSLRGIANNKSADQLDPRSLTSAFVTHLLEIIISRLTSSQISIF